MDVNQELAILKQQVEEKSLALEEARAEIRADEAYFDRLGARQLLLPELRIVMHLAHPTSIICITTVPMPPSICCQQ